VIEALTPRASQVMRCWLLIAKAHILGLGASADPSARHVPQRRWPQLSATRWLEIGSRSWPGNSRYGISNRALGASGSRGRALPNNAHRATVLRMPLIAGSERHGVEDVVLLVAVAHLDTAHRSVSIQDDRDGDLD